MPRPAGHLYLPQSLGVSSPNLEEPGDLQAAELAGSGGSWLNVFAVVLW